MSEQSSNLPLALSSTVILDSGSHGTHESREKFV
jgi:hypothetical protein